MAQTDLITVAVPKGRLLEESSALFERALGVSPRKLLEGTRKLAADAPVDLPEPLPAEVVPDEETPPGPEERHRLRQAARVLRVVIHEERRVPGIDGVEGAEVDVEDADEVGWLLGG